MLGESHGDSAVWVLTPVRKPKLNPDCSVSIFNNLYFSCFPNIFTAQHHFLVLGNLNQPIEVTALYSFEGQQPGDLNFQAGDRITVISKTDSHFDWWEGKLRGQTGIFPANYVTMN